VPQSPGHRRNAPVAGVFLRLTVFLIFLIYHGNNHYKWVVQVLIGF